MALIPAKPVNDLAQRGGFVNEGKGWGYDVTKDQSVPSVGATAGAYDDATARLSTLPGLITGIYDKLRAAGKDSDAWLLRDATERFTNSGSAMGVNAFGRAQALADLQGRLLAAANSRDAGISKQESDQLSSIQMELAKLGADKAQQMFDQQMRIANFRENKLGTIRNSTALNNAAQKTVPFNRLLPVPSASNAGVQSLVNTPAKAPAAAPQADNNGPVHYWGGKWRPTSELHPDYIAQQRKLGLPIRNMVAGASA